MKKTFFIFLLAVLSLMAFSESIFTFHIGTDIQKGINIAPLYDVVKNSLGKQFGQDSDQVPSPNSKVLIPMLSVGLDMQFASHTSGFTFFWNHAFLYADHVVGYQVLDFVYKDKLNAEAVDGKTTFKNKLYVYSSEMLFGGTFRRENAFNIHFGIGFKTQFNPSMIKDIIGIVKSQIPQDKVQMYAMVAGLGGTFGFSYYFNNVVGLTFSVSDFVGLGGTIFGQFNGGSTNEGGYPTSGRAMLNLGLNNNFAMKFGLSLRANGTRGDAL